jgi:hypothetical protein
MDGSGSCVANARIAAIKIDVFEGKPGSTASTAAAKTSNSCTVNVKAVVRFRNEFLFMVVSLIFCGIS